MACPRAIANRMAVLTHQTTEFVALASTYSSLQCARGRLVKCRLLDTNAYSTCVFRNPCTIAGACLTGEYNRENPQIFLFLVQGLSLFIVSARFTAGSSSCWRAVLAREVPFARARRVVRPAGDSRCQCPRIVPSFTKTQHRKIICGERGLQSIAEARKNVTVYYPSAIPSNNARIA